MPLFNGKEAICQLFNSAILTQLFDLWAIDLWAHNLQTAAHNIAQNIALTARYLKILPHNKPETARRIDITRK